MGWFSKITDNIKKIMGKDAYRISVGLSTAGGSEGSRPFWKAVEKNVSSDLGEMGLQSVDDPTLTYEEYRDKMKPKKPDAGGPGTPVVRSKEVATQKNRELTPEEARAQFGVANPNDLVIQSWNGEYYRMPAGSNTWADMITGAPSSGPPPEPTTTIPMTQEAILEDQWAFYKDVFLPLEEDMLLSATLRPDVAHQKDAAASAFTKQVGLQAAATQRKLAGYGVNWNDPKFAGTKRGISLAQGAAEIDTRNKLQQAAADLPLQRMSQLAMLGQGIPAQLESSLSNAANINTALSAQKDALAGAYASGLAGLGSTALSYYGNRQPQQPNYNLGTNLPAYNTNQYNLQNSYQSPSQVAWA